VVLGLAVLLGATNPSRTDWIQWQVQQMTAGSATGTGAPYSWAYQHAVSNPYGNDVLLSWGVEEYATGQVGYLGLLGHWIEAMGPTTQLLPQGGRVVVPNPYIGFWGWVYRLVAPPG
jgi:hypothetical protein